MDFAKEMREMFTVLKPNRKELLIGLAIGAGLYATMICMCKVIAVMWG